VGSLFIEEDEVVGTKSTRDELVSWLVRGVSKHTHVHDKANLLGNRNCSGANRHDRRDHTN
jgi:hypothetical protein